MMSMRSFTGFIWASLGRWRSVWNRNRLRPWGTSSGCSVRGGDFSWPPVGTFHGHQRGPHVATSGDFLMATDIPHLYGWSVVRVTIPYRYSLGSLRLTDELSHIAPA